MYVIYLGHSAGVVGTIGAPWACSCRYRFQIMDFHSMHFVFVCARIASFTSKDLLKARDTALGSSTSTSTISQVEAATTYNQQQILSKTIEIVLR